MEALQATLTSFAWWVTAGAAVLVLCAKFFSNRKSTWAWIGVILLIVAIGNATILASYDKNGSAALAALFGTVVYGGLGAALVANWLLDGAV